MLASALCGAPGASDAQDVVAAPEVAETTTAEGARDQHDSGLSVRMLSGRTWLDTDSAPLRGVGLAVEHDFFDGALTVEVAGEWLYDPERNAALVELVAEHGFEVTDRTAIIVGAGPLFAAAHEENPAWGALAVVAIETELAPRWQLFVELDGAVLFDPELVLETDLGTGVMWSF
jgi:hypothetical protein